MHGSLLPKYRGRAPINWAILHGETQTGVTLHEMVEKPDAGDIIDQESVAIDFTDTAKIVFEKIIPAACTILARNLDALKTGSASRTQQDLQKGQYFTGRKPADGVIDWSQSAIQIYNLIRAVTHPYPGAFTYYEEKKFTIWWATPHKNESSHNTKNAGEILSTTPLMIQTGDGLLEIIEIQGENEDAKQQFLIGDTLFSTKVAQ
jgi:methionyl-tRNA formyltransferase